MSDDAAAFANRHGLDRLRAADQDGFAAALTQTATAGALLPRPGDKESGPANVFRPTPTPSLEPEPPNAD